jgi:redox-sensing transcriptional repressor
VIHLDELVVVMGRIPIAIGVIATPATVAQTVADRLIGAGISSILNFAPTVLNTPEHVDVRQVDLVAELQVLAFYGSHRDRSASSGAREHTIARSVELRR